jgi:hypothetical protein
MACTWSAMKTENCSLRRFPYQFVIQPMPADADEVVSKSQVLIQAVSISPDKASFTQSCQVAGALRLGRVDELGELGHPVLSGGDVVEKGKPIFICEVEQKFRDSSL